MPILLLLFFLSVSPLVRRGSWLGNPRTVNPLLIQTQAGAMRIPSLARPVHFHCRSEGRAEVIPSDPSSPRPLC